MRLSIILATANGSSIIGDTLKSISGIICRANDSVQLIVVDQSFDDKTYNVLKEFNNKIDFLYIHSLKKGLSYSRNLGLDLADGDVICFGDDDCFYENELLSKLDKIFSSGNYELVSAGVYVPSSNNLTSYSKYNVPALLTRYNLLGRVTSISIFIKSARFLENNIKFNEQLGLGATYGSCEEIELVYRLLELNFRSFYDPRIRVFHENPYGYNENKTFQYSLGHGALTRILISKLKFSYSYLAFLKITKTFLRFPAQLFVKKNLYPKSYFLGFFSGLFRIKKNR